MNYYLGILYEEYEVGFMHDYFSPILKAFRDHAEREGFGVCFLSRVSRGEKCSYIDYCREHDVDGVIVVSCDFFTDDVQELMRSDIPCVTIDHVYHGHTCVMSGNRQAIAQIMRRVLAMGHRRIAYITGTNDDVTRIRQAGVLRAIEDAGLSIGDEYLLHSAYHDPDGGYRTVKQLLSLSVPPTCILMPDDISAFGAFRAIDEMGLRVGEDISVIGFDGAKIASVIRPLLTTVKQDTHAMGAIAAEQLIKRLRKPRLFEPDIIAVPCEIIEGETLLPVKG